MFVLLVQLILPVLGLRPLEQAELNRLNEFKVNQGGTEINEPEPSTSAGHPCPSPPPLPPPPEDLEAPSSPISRSDPKCFPVVSPIGRNSRSVKNVETENKHFSFLSDSSVEGYDGTVGTSTPLKPQSKSFQGLHHDKSPSTIRSKMPGIGEVFDEKAVTVTQKNSIADSRMGCSSGATRSEAIISSSIESSTSHLKNTPKCQNKISPSTMRKLQKFAYVVRPTSNDSKESKEKLNIISSPIHGKGDNNAATGSKNKKPTPTFEVESLDQLSGMSSYSLPQPKGPRKDELTLQENFDPNSLLRTQRPMAAANSGNQAGTRQLQRACELVTKSVTKNDTVNSSHQLRSGNAPRDPQSKTNSPTGLNKLLSYCRNTSPLISGTNKLDCNNHNNENRTISPVFDDKRKNVQSVKRKVQDASNSLFKLNYDDNLSDSDIEFDWNPLSKKKKS